MSWLTDRQRNGGIDSVVVPQLGTLWLAGKHRVAPDPEQVLIGTRAGSVWCLNEPHELADRYPAYVTWLENDDRARWSPIPDLGTPSVQQMTGIVDGVRADLESSGSVIVHCGAGFGRAGTVAACVLISAGVTAADALAAVSSARPGAGPESGLQAELVAHWLAASC